MSHGSRPNHPRLLAISKIRRCKMKKNANQTIDLLIQSKLVKESDRDSAVAVLSAIDLLQEIKIVKASHEFPELEALSKEFCSSMHREIISFEERIHHLDRLIESLRPLGKAPQAAELIEHCDSQAREMKAYQEYLRNYMKRIPEPVCSEPVRRCNQEFTEAIEKLQKLFH